MYDWFSWGYTLFSKIAFAYIGMDEETGRREITDRLEPHGGRVLGGVHRPGCQPAVSHESFGCQRSIRAGYFPWTTAALSELCGETRLGVWILFLGNGEQLPFQDESFQGVFHVGGINFFNDKKSAIDEMIRIAKPGARILIADETEKGAQGYEKFIPGFKKSFGGKRKEIAPPIDLVPSTMLETRVFDVWKGWLYCLEFRKP